MRIISLACFIFVLVAAPSMAMLMNGMPVDDVPDKQVSVSEAAVKPAADEETENEIPKTSENTGESVDEEELQQSETEVYKPTLSESYMLKELFSNVVFDDDDTVYDTKTTGAEAPSVTVNEPGSQTVTSEEPKTPVKEQDIPTAPNAEEPKNDEPENVNPEPSKPSSNVIVTGSSKGRITTVRVLDSASGTVSTLDLDEYLAQVIISEMPSYAGDEALKAQAVASRTFVVNRIVNSSTHDNADVCTNPGHCQAFLEKNAFIAKYGNSGQHYYDRAYSAAKQTSGQIITYNGSPITAAYHASSGGSTMASADVWGGSLPYLVSVSSPEKDDPEMLALISAHKTYSKEEFIRRLVSAGYSSAGEYYDSDFSEFLGAAVQTASGKVDYMTVAGEYISGQKFKSIFSLRSTCFTVNYDADNITFVCLGYGHGAGMSQLGACTMAKQGSSYTDILTHYYTGVEITVW